MADPRIDWIKRKTIFGLDVEGDAFDELLARDEGQFGADLTKFLDTRENPECVVMFYGEKRMIEVPVEVEAPAQDEDIDVIAEEGEG
eukprot:CAMPEP_0114561202 /NCGR_PEP_ID=MMETSP0114-20121206/11877_1 /TAXON_ID=31324 /ORGANISM="Goniomonas sp, Strain m" /LENGTH=86 /DNA_ID=CAMNT_0001746819 /DNA_START=108 /DNA_END=365 /DNA_ORIENTATION=-